MKRILIPLVIILSFVSCNKKFDYPESKIWKHGVYSKYEAQELEGVFDGLEVDVIYSLEKDNIYVGRVEADTSKNLPLDEWFAMLKEPDKMCYWIDFKNLSADNVNQALDVLDVLVEKYQIYDKFFVENQSVDVLKIVKEKKYSTMLWVDNLYYWNKKDTVSVIKKIRSQIDVLHPDAISCEYTMFPLLCDSFPEQNVHFWDTPKDYTHENVEFTKKLCENPSVKVVLVDYPTPEIFD